MKFDHGDRLIGYIGSNTTTVSFNSFGIELLLLGDPALPDAATLSLQGFDPDCHR